MRLLRTVTGRKPAVVPAPISTFCARLNMRSLSDGHDVGFKPRQTVIDSVARVVSSAAKTLMVQLQSSSRAPLADIQNKEMICRVSSPQTCQCSEQPSIEGIKVWPMWLLVWTFLLDVHHQYQHPGGQKPEGITGIHRAFNSLLSISTYHCQAMSQHNGLIKGLFRWLWKLTMCHIIQAEKT